MTTLRTAPDVILREPREAELPLCRLLLPRAAARPLGRHFRLSWTREAKLVAALSYRDDGTALGGLALHVIPPYRRQGIASFLLAYATLQAIQLQRPVIFADVDLKTDIEAEPFLTSQGFSKAGSITFGEIAIQALRNSLEAGRERLDAANQLPPSARILTLAEAPQSEIASLYAQHIAHTRPLPGLHEIIKLEDATESIALLLGDKLAGFVLARLNEGTLHIPAWVVDPAFRGHGIGFALLGQLAQRLRGQVERLQFEFTDAAMLTPRMLNVPGCRVTRIATRFERRVTT